MQFKIVVVDPHSQEKDRATFIEESTAMNYEEVRQVLMKVEKNYLKYCLQKYGSLRKATKEHFKVPLGTIHGRLKKFGLLE